MSSNASQKVTFRNAKRHLLPTRTFPPAGSRADTALQGRNLRPAEGRKTIYTSAAPPPPPSRPASGIPPSPPPQGALHALLDAAPAAQRRPYPRRRARMPARHHAPHALRRGRGGGGKARLARGKGGGAARGKGKGGMAHDPLSDGRRRGKTIGKKGKGGVGTQKKSNDRHGYCST